MVRYSQKFISLMSDRIAPIQNCASESEKKYYRIWIPNYRRHQTPDSPTQYHTNV